VVINRTASRLVAVTEDLGVIFDRVAESYDRVRPGYPDGLIDAACSILGLDAGSRVVEVGCGSGKLTRGLVERGLCVAAVDPGSELVAVARRNLGESSVQFDIAAFEDVDMPAGTFDAVFSATAFHWVDPAVGWAKAARVLRPRGGLALLTHTIELEPEFLAAWREVVPEAAAWISRDPETLWKGAETRRNNISELWAWLVKRDIARPEAAELFEDVQLRTVQLEIAETAAEVVAHVRTQSEYLRLDSSRQRRLDERISAFVENQGGTYRPTTFATLATARMRA
jgi:ubiquinone/menaquinone biosynthesis C-methylase UbiE